jgi:hypothetical protein
MFNVYYEIPCAGGGNERYANRASALAAAKSIAGHYADAYVQATRVADGYVVFTHDGAAVAA